MTGTLVLTVLLAFCVIEAQALCRFGPWINNYTPSSELFPDERKEASITSGGGDVECLSPDNRTTYCGGQKATTIECQDSNGQDSHSNGQKHVICDLDSGLKCYNRYNHGTGCLDYKIRYLCSCPGGVTDRPNTGPPNIGTRSPVSGPGGAGYQAVGTIGGAVNHGVGSAVTGAPGVPGAPIAPGATGAHGAPIAPGGGTGGGSGHSATPTGTHGQGHNSASVTSTFLCLHLMVAVVTTIVLF